MKYHNTNIANHRLISPKDIWGPIQALAVTFRVSKRVAKAIREYTLLRHAFTKAYGVRKATEILKDLNSRSKLVAVGVKPEGITLGGTWISMNRKGLPRRLKHLNSLIVDSNVWVQRIGLSITNSVELVRLPPVIKLESIIHPFTGDNSFLQDLSHKCKQWAAGHLALKGKVTNEPKRLHTSFSNNLLGYPAFLGSMIELALIADAMESGGMPHWLELKSFAKRLNRDDLVVMLDDFLTWIRANPDRVDKVLSLGKVQHYLGFSRQIGKLCLGRLIFISDKAGKTRTVFTTMWFIQEMLTPLHDYLYDLLGSFPQDGTRSHNEAAQQVKEWTEEGRQLWSYDLKDATDRMPLAVQTAVMEGICFFQPEIPAVWKQIMTICPMYYHKIAHGHYQCGMVNYEVGQPMGLKTSWAAFAITHHIIVNLLAVQVGVAPEYVIIGDDICIANKALADAYAETLSSLGVTISYSKSITPSQLREGVGSAAEFAKRIFCDGIERSPITSNLLYQIYKNRNYAAFLGLIQEARAKWDGNPIRVDSERILLTPALACLFRLLPKKAQDAIACVLGSASVSTSQEGYVETGEADYKPEDYVSMENPWKGIDRLTVYHYLGNEISERLVANINLLNEIKSHVNKQVVTTQDVVKNDVLADCPVHPIHKIIKEIDEVILGCYRAVANGDLNENLTLQLGLDLVVLRDMVTTGKCAQLRKDVAGKRFKVAVGFWKKILRDCQDGFVFCEYL